MQFKKAVKIDAKLRLALCGPAGAGKTYSLLSIATELGGPIAYVDTEHGSASKYADLFNFDVIEPATFDPRELVETISEAAKAGYKVFCIDSLSHYWMGVGGELEMVDAAAKRIQGNSFAAWKNVTPVHNKLIDTIIGAPIHVLVSMRTKTEWVIEQVNGKNTPRKIGLAPVMRDGIEFEFDVCGDLDQDNTLTVTKSRCSDLAGKVINRPGKEMAITLKKWLTGTPRNNPTTNTNAGSTQEQTAGAASAIPGTPVKSPDAPSLGNTPHKPSVAEQIPAELAAIWAAMKDKSSIEQAIGAQLEDLCKKLPEDAAYENFNRILSTHGAQAWQDLGTLNKAKAFVRDLWVFASRVAPPPPAPGIDDSDVPANIGGKAA